MNVAIVFAGGIGTRMGAGIPKQFIEIEGKPILVHTLLLFQHHHRIDRIYLAVQEEYADYVGELVKQHGITKLAGTAPGGDTAQDSIYNALVKARTECPEDAIVLLHDGIRPFVGYDVITNNIEGVEKFGTAITCVPCYQTIVVSSDGQSVGSVPYRKETFTAQAPQSFRLGDILAAHEIVRQRPERYENMVDNCTILRSLDRPVHMVEGNRGNIKVTTPEDIYILKAMFRYRADVQAARKDKSETSLEV